MSRRFITKALLMFNVTIAAFSGQKLLEQVSSPFYMVYFGASLFFAGVFVTAWIWLPDD